MVSIWDMLKVRGQKVQGTKKQFSIIDPFLLCPTPNPTPVLGLRDISSLYIIHSFFSSNFSFKKKSYTGDFICLFFLLYRLGITGFML